MHANCTFRNDSDPLEVNKVTAYGVFKEKTKGITSLKTYSLDSSSLYVNGIYVKINILLFYIYFGNNRFFFKIEAMNFIS